MATKLNTKKPGAKKLCTKKPTAKFDAIVRNFHDAFGEFAFSLTAETASPECAVALVAECIHHEMGMYLDAVHRAERKARAAMKKGKAK